MRPIQDESFEEAVQRSDSSAAGCYIRREPVNLLLLLEKFFISIRNKNKNWDCVEMDFSQSVISLYSLNCHLQNSEASKELFLDWTSSISTLKYDYYKHSYYENENMVQPVDMTIPNVALLQREDKIYAFTRLMAGNRYMRWNFRSNSNIIIYRYKSKSDNDYLVSKENQTCSTNLKRKLEMNLDQLINKLYNSNISKIVFLISSNFLESDIKTKVTQYSCHVVHVIKGLKKIEHFGTYLDRYTAQHLVLTAFHKTLFELLDGEESQTTPNYAPYIETDKDVVSKEISEIIVVENIRYGEVFYRYIASNGGAINKRDIYIIIKTKNKSYNKDVVVLISSSVYQKLFYRLFDDDMICITNCINKLKDILVTTILDESSTVFYNRSKSYLVII